MPDHGTQMACFLYIISLFAFVANCKQLLLFNEFEFTFDWNQNDYNEFPRLIQSHHRRQKCTNRIPIIFKHLCVDWNRNRGFRFKYSSHVNGQNDLAQTDWFYRTKSDKIYSAHNAAKYYKELDGDSFLMSDDSEWNEVSLLDDGYTYKQCKTRPSLQECAHFDTSNNILTFNIKVPRFMHQHPLKNHNQLPANLQSSAHSDFDNLYDFEYDTECMQYMRMCTLYPCTHTHTLWVFM